MGQQLWQVVGEAFAATPQAREDRARLAATLALREGEDSVLRPHVRRMGRFAARAVRRWLPRGRGLTCLLPPHWVVADLGCGTGPALAALAPAVRRVVGIDREPRMLAAAATRTEGFDNVQLRQGGLTALPLEDEEVHAATCLLVLHHVPDLARTRSPKSTGASSREGGWWWSTCGPTIGGIGAKPWAIDTSGSNRDALKDLARGSGLVPERFRPLSPAPDAQGPPLFIATFAKSGPLDGRVTASSTAPARSKREHQPERERRRHPRSARSCSARLEPSDRRRTPSPASRAEREKEDKQRNTELQELPNSHWSKKELLRRIRNPHNAAYEQKVYIPELTFVGTANQPDFGEVLITFYPREWTIELKSLKQYKDAFRDSIASYERLANVMFDDLMEVYAPVRVRLMMKLRPRGGISSCLTIDSDWKIRGGNEDFNDWGDNVDHFGFEVHNHKPL